MPPSKRTPPSGASKIPPDFEAWLKKAGAKDWICDTASSPGIAAGRNFLLTTVQLEKLQFEANDYNPREANPKKVNELKASVIQLSLLTPLTCAYLNPEDRDDSEAVVLVDGRHRYNALKQLAEDPAWGAWKDNARVDLKVYYGLSKSDLFMLATYLNRTRKNLRKGEYYKVVLDIYESRELELQEQYGRPVTETEVFDSISTRAVPNKAFDLSIGRIVAITAFDEEDNRGWYPMVGLSQKYRFPERPEGYCPLTAGNLAVFLGSLCKKNAYGDHGEKRAIEITNVIRLGRLFREHLLTGLVTDYAVATATTVGSKHWVLDAYGKILARTKLFGKQENGEAPFASTSVDWKTFGRVMGALKEVMEGQAELVNEHRDQEPPPPDLLSVVWTYQTQTRQIEGPLAKALNSRVPGIGILP